jgi:hypothetical protein
MLTIRDAQMETFGKARRSALANALVDEAVVTLIVNGHPFDRVELPERLEAILDAATRAGLDRKPDAIRFTLLACRYFGQNLEPLPLPVADILYAKGVPAEVKLGMLQDFLAQYGAKAGA